MKKSLLVLIDDPERLSDYVTEIPEIAWELVTVSDEPLTIVYPGGIILPQILSQRWLSWNQDYRRYFCRELIRNW